MKEVGGLGKLGDFFVRDPLVRCREICHGSKLGQGCCPTPTRFPNASEGCRDRCCGDETRYERCPRGHGGYARLNEAAPARFRRARKSGRDRLGEVMMARGDPYIDPGETGVLPVGKRT